MMDYKKEKEKKKKEKKKKKKKKRETTASALLTATGPNLWSLSATDWKDEYTAYDVIM